MRSPRRAVRARVRDAFCGATATRGAGARRGSCLPAVAWGVCSRGRGWWRRCRAGHRRPRWGRRWGRCGDVCGSGGRAENEVRLSAGCSRAASVKASITATRSNILLRRPVLRWASIPASSSRDTALRAVRSVALSSFRALPAVTTAADPYAPHSDLIREEPAMSGPSAVASADASPLQVASLMVAAAVGRTATCGASTPLQWLQAATSGTTPNRLPNATRLGSCHDL